MGKNTFLMLHKTTEFQKCHALWILCNIPVPYVLKHRHKQPKQKTFFNYEKYDEKRWNTERRPKLQQIVMFYIFFRLLVCVSVWNIHVHALAHENIIISHICFKQQISYLILLFLPSFVGRLLYAVCFPFPYVINIII